jgi:Tol biopolymer transport system component
MKRYPYFHLASGRFFLIIGFFAGGCLWMIPEPPSVSPTGIVPAETSAPTVAETPVDAASATPAGGGRLLFVSRSDGNLDIYGIDSDGSHLASLTGNPGDDTDPSWSPDGNRIAFGSDRDGNWEIYAMDSDGSNLVRLTDDPAEDIYPVWSPRGDRIAFLSGRGGGGYGEVFPYVMDADGSHATQLSGGPVVQCLPSWSPDGRRLAVCSFDGYPANISVLEADGSGGKLLTEGEWNYLEPPWDLNPAWSPDGKWIVFRSNREDPHPVQCDASDDGCNFELYVVDPDSLEEIRLTFTPYDERDPAWSLYDGKIAFVSGAWKAADIFVIDVEDQKAVNLTDGPGMESNPVWSPDGRQIAFISNRDGNYELYVMNADGSGVLRLTDNPADDFNPVWRPE